MRIALIGATGQLGSDLQKILPEAGHEVVALGHKQIELSSEDSVDGYLNRTAPDAVINCAAYNLVDQAEEEPEIAYAVNSRGPRRLAHWCGRADIPLVHFSSDFVFGLDGSRNEPYSETDTPGPQSAYAASKLQGEYFVRNHCPKSFVLRTCGLYGVAALQGAGKGNFIETMIRLGNRLDKLTVGNDQRCTPTATADLAAATVELIATDAFGLYHATNSGDTTWHALAAEVFERKQINVELAPITSAEFGAVAARPPYSVLNCEKLESVIGRPMAGWQDALAQYLEAREA